MSVSRLAREEEGRGRTGLLVRLATRTEVGNGRVERPHDPHEECREGEGQGDDEEDDEEPARLEGDEDGTERVAVGAKRRQLPGPSFVNHAEHSQHAKSKVDDGKQPNLEHHGSQARAHNAVAHARDEEHEEA